MPKIPRPSTSAVGDQSQVNVPRQQPPMPIIHKIQVIHRAPRTISVTDDEDEEWDKFEIIQGNFSESVKNPLKEAYDKIEELEKEISMLNTRILNQKGYYETRLSQQKERDGSIFKKHVKTFRFMTSLFQEQVVKVKQVTKDKEKLQKEVEDLKKEKNNLCEIYNSSLDEIKNLQEKLNSVELKKRKFSMGADEIERLWQVFRDSFENDDVTSPTTNVEEEVDASSASLEASHDEELILSANILQADSEHHRHRQPHQKEKELRSETTILYMMDKSVATFVLLGLAEKP